MTKPVLIDAYCGGGGASMGYSRAGFEVIGIDKFPQPRYPFTFIQEDVAELDLADVARQYGAVAIGGSPPCHDHSVLRHRTGKDHGTGWLLDKFRQQCIATGLPYIIENVESAPLLDPVTLCGSMFVLGAKDHDGVFRTLKRHRKFESGGLKLDPPTDMCKGLLIGGVYGHGGGRVAKRGIAFATEAAQIAMGIDWLPYKELSQAIPPAYTHYLGLQLMEHLNRV